MAAGTAQAPAGVRARQPRWRGTLEIVIILLVVALALGIFLVRRFWPFTEERVVERLQESSDSRVQVRSFRREYFPRPGCVLDGVTFIHGDASHPLITIQRLTITSTYLALFGYHVREMNAVGLRIFIPPFGTGQPFHPQPSTIVIDTMVANGATLEFASRNPKKPPLQFAIHEATLRAVGAQGPTPYRIRVHNPEPPGELSVDGELGDWNMNDPGQTQIAGNYDFENADLGVYGGIGGTLSSEGKFAGKLEHIDISGATDTPNFEVSSGHHPVRLTSQFNAYVDAVHGDTYLNRVVAQFRRTTVVVEGSIAGSHGPANGKVKGKIALLALAATNGRIEDILGLFVEAKRPPMSGAIALHAQVEIPPGDRPFLEKIRLRGSFGVSGGEFANPSTQEGVNHLSAGAQGQKSDDPETVLTDLTGKVLTDGGVATFSDLSFGIPGAAARMHGNYGLIDHKIDLHGQMHVLTKISNTSSGVKALLLKTMDPFFKKRKKGEILPVRISGTYEKPAFGLDLRDKKAQTQPPPIAGSAVQ